jgi:MFS family permease
MGYLELLRSQPKFRRLWLGQLISECGDWLQLIAILQLFPTAGRSVELLAGVFIVRMLPWIALAPIAGAVADRFHRGEVMVACDVGRAVVVLGYLLVRGPEDVFWIYALLLAQESLAAFFEPARSAAIPQIVPQEALLTANSLAGATWSAMLAIGSALGGAIAFHVGSRAAFFADAATFAASAALIAGTPIPRVPGAEGRGPDRFGLGAVREGVAYLAAHRPQAAATAVKGLWGLSGGFVFLFSVYAGEVFTPRGEDPAGATGLLYAGRGVGALVGPLVARRLLGESVRDLRRGIQIAFPLAAAAMIAFAHAPTAAIAALLLVVAHAGGSIVWVSSTQILQLTVPNELQGRAFSVEFAALTLTMALSNGFAGGALGRDLLSLRGVTFAMAAAAATSAAVWALAMGRLGPRLEAAAIKRDPRA